MWRLPEETPNRQGGDHLGVINIKNPETGNWEPVGCLSGMHEAVLCVPQELTEDQQEQARKNMGAAAAGSGNLMPVLSKTYTRSGVTFTPTRDGLIIHGTATEDCYCKVYDDASALPEGLRPGKSYCLQHYCDDLYVTLNIRTADASGTWKYIYNSHCGGEFTIPEDAVGMQIRFYVPPNIPCENMHMKPRIYEVNTLDHVMADKKHRKPMLTIIYDDGMADFHTYVLPIIQEKKVPISMAIVPGFVENAVSGVMTWEQIEACFLGGAEVLDHTYAHITPATRAAMTVEELEHEYLMGRRILQHKGFHPPCALVFNGSTANLANCRTAAYRVYKAGFNASTGGINYPDPPDPYNINRYSTDNKTLQTLTGWIDELVAAGTGWMVWTRHNSNATTEDQAEAAAVLSQAIDYALANNVDIVTVERGLYEYLGIG
jgi:hypothetical protein